MSTVSPPALGAEIFELPGKGRALFTARAHGNLSSVGGLRAEHGLSARERLREAIGVRHIVRGYQVHGTVVGRVFEKSLPHDSSHGLCHDDDALSGQSPASQRKDISTDRTRPLADDSALQPSFEADGHAVAMPAVAAMVHTADCIPVVLGTQGAVAALHAGWRGLAAGVIEEGVRALRDVGGRGGIVALVGPCAGACCYEVGEEVHAAFGGAHRNGRLIDLRAIAHERLSAAGVARVIDLQACTICDERYFSYRREGSYAGRQAGIAWLS